MTKPNDSNNDFDDLDLIDDIEDDWDDLEEDIKEDTNDLDIGNDVDDITVKKKSIIKPLLIIALISGGAIYAYLSFVQSPTTTNQLPIIKLGESPKPDLILPAETQAIITETNIIPPPKENTPSPAENNNALTLDTNSSENILTPMPNNIDSSNIILPELGDQNIASDLTEDIASNQQESAFSEDDLLLQTDVIFEDGKTLDSSAQGTQDTAQQEHPISAIADEKTLEQSEVPEKTTDPEVKIELEPEILEVKEISEVKAPPIVIEELAKTEDTAIIIDTVDETATIEAEAEAVAPPSPKVKPAEKIAEKTITKPTKKESQIWVIRAAQSGSAVIYNKTTREMLSVEINDNVAGIGRIKSIKTVDGRWVITGTSGKIKQ